MILGVFIGSNQNILSSFKFKCAMVGLFVMYLVGKGFFDLAEKFNKNQWLYAVSGVASYYLVQTLVGVGLGIYWGLKFGAEAVEGMVDDHYWIITLTTVALGALGCWGFYEFLKMRWSKPITHTVPENSDLLDDEFLIG